MNSAIIANHNKEILSFEVEGHPYESRGSSIETLIKDTVSYYDIKNDFKFKVYPTDRPVVNGYSFSTTTEEYSKCFPCFVFVSYPECGLKSYQDGISLTNTQPQTNKIGWIGAPLSLPRQLFCDKLGKTNFSEAIVNNWVRNNPKDLASNTPTFLSYQQQVNRWKYLIDFEGHGYSCRTKILIHSPRITFIVDRLYKEFWYEHLIPWTHYVPVKWDLSDLKQNYDRVESDDSLQKHILYHANIFAQRHLSYNAAMEQVYKIIQANGR
jgi:hypothetical protein